MEEYDYYDPSINSQYYIEHNRIRINPSQAITGTSFNGNFSFDINISKDQCLIVPETKIYMTFRGLQSSNTATPFVTRGLCQLTQPAAYAENNNRFIGCFSSGGVMNTLSKIHLELADGGGVIQGIENVPQLNQMIRMTQDNINLSMENSQDPFFIIESGETIGRQCATESQPSIKTYKTNPYRRLSIIETIVKNAHKQGLTYTDSSKDITISSAIPLAFFQEQIKAYQGRYTIRCFVEPNWRQNLIMSIQANNPQNSSDKRCFSYITLNDDPTTLQFSDVRTAGMINLSVIDVWLEVTIIKISERPLGLRNILLNPFNLTSNNIPSNTAGNINLTISTTPHTHKIIIGFQKNRFNDIRPTVNGAVNVSEETSLTLASGNVTLFNAINLQSISVRFLDNTYPNTPYNLQFIYNDIVTDGLTPPADIPTSKSTYSRYTPPAYVVPANPTTAELLAALSIHQEPCPIDEVPATPINSLINHGDNIRAYNDFCDAMEYDYKDRPMSYHQWLHNPLFCFKFISTTNISSNIDVQLTFRGTTSQAITMNTVYYHKGLLSCNYGEDAVQYSYNYLV